MTDLIFYAHLVSMTPSCGFTSLIAYGNNDGIWCYSLR